MTTFGYILIALVIIGTMIYILSLKPKSEEYMDYYKNESDGRGQGQYAGIPVDDAFKNVK